MEIRETRQLYVRKFRDVMVADSRPLSIEERLAGWEEGKTWDDEPRVVNEGDQRGALRERRASHVLCWSVQPGDDIVAVLGVTLDWEYSPDATLAGGFSRRLLQICCDPTVRGRGGLLAFVTLSTVLGRAASLGEDGAEDAFDGDALRDQLEAFTRDDTRDSLCSATFVEQLFPESESIDVNTPEWKAAFDREYESWKVKKCQHVVTIVPGAE